MGQFGGALEAMMNLGFGPLVWGRERIGNGEIGKVSKRYEHYPEIFEVGALKGISFRSVWFPGQSNRYSRDISWVQGCLLSHDQGMLFTQYSLWSGVGTLETLCPQAVEGFKVEQCLLESQ